MFDFFAKLLDTSDFPSRWHCGEWSAAHGWLHIVSDLLVFGAYAAIPLILAFLARNRRDVPFPRILWCFVAFIFACGTVHLVEAFIFWWPAYRLSAVTKAATALVSWATVAALFPVVPRALEMRSPEELQREIDERKRAQEELAEKNRQLQETEAGLRRAHDELEERVRARTAELQEANTATRESEERFRAIVDNAAVGVSLVDLRRGRHLVQVNRALEHILGYGQDELIGKTFLELTHPEDRDESRRRFEELVTGRRGSFQVEKRYLRKDGGVVWSRTVVSCVRDERRGPIYAIGVVQDVTQEKQAEFALKQINEELRQSREWLQLTLEAAHVGTWEWDVKTGEVAWSDNLPAIHGTAPEAFDGTFEAVLREVHPDDLPRFEQAIQTALDDGGEYRCEYRVASEETNRWVEGKGRVFRDHTGRPVRMAGVCADVSERKQAEQWLQLLGDAGALLAGALEYGRTLNEVAGLMVPNLADWCTIDVITENGETELAALAHVDSEKTELAREVRRLYPPQPDAMQGVPRVLRSGRPELHPYISENSLEQSAHDGEHLRLLHELGMRSAIVVPLQARGRTIGALTLVSAQSEFHYTQQQIPFFQELARRCALAIDNAWLYRAIQEELAERQRAEQALQRANAELQQKNREMEQFVYTVSHDLKSPLVTTMGFVGLLKEDLAEGRTEEVHDAAGRIERSAQRMSELIDDLLELSRIGRFRDEPEQVDVGALLEELRADYADRLRQAGAVLEMEPDIPPVTADRRRLHEVFENLLSNALKYGCDGEGARIRVGAVQTDAEVRYFMQDNGPGVPEKYRGKIFDLFQRLQSDGEGTGVGLAIVAKIMEVHGGAGLG